MKNISAKSLAIGVYERIKSEIFDFALLPGDRFTETEVAARVGVSRTPVREALYRLEREGYIDVSARNGWSVKPFDFGLFEDLYDVRIVLELAAIRKLCGMESATGLKALSDVWLVPVNERIRDAQAVCEMDEAFHQNLLIAAGNPEMARIHRDISERIRIIRRLDFTQQERIDSTYDEHAAILRSVAQRTPDETGVLLRTHIEASKAVVRQITLHRLHSARTALAAQDPERRTA
ncbi:MAG TPA: GntR family transcriptional regulator [Burkholderiales bacterium]|nr:GntR family transcriptional regulator [Burkholderiales bacterium]